MVYFIDLTAQIYTNILRINNKLKMNQLHSIIEPIIRILFIIKFAFFNQHIFVNLRSEKNIKSKKE